MRLLAAVHQRGEDLLARSGDARTRRRPTKQRHRSVVTQRGAVEHQRAAALDLARDLPLSVRPARVGGDIDRGRGVAGVARRLRSAVGRDTRRHISRRRHVPRDGVGRNLVHARSARAFGDADSRLAGGRPRREDRLRLLRAPRQVTQRIFALAHQRARQRQHPHHQGLHHLTHLHRTHIGPPHRPHAVHLERRTPPLPATANNFSRCSRQRNIPPYTR